MKKLQKKELPKSVLEIVGPGHTTASARRRLELLLVGADSHTRHEQIIQAMAALVPLERLQGHGLIKYGY